LKVRGQLVRSASVPLSATTRLSAHYLLEVASWRTICDTCQVPLRRQRTSTHYPIGLSLGQPLALVRDLSAQIEGAHQQVMPDIPDLICHYHFLENVGAKLCEKHHTKLIACLRRLKIRPALCSLRHDLVRYTKQNGCITPAQIEQLLTAPEQATHLDPAQKRRALAYLILCWLEDYGADLQGEYFPFDLPSLALYRRYRTVHGWLLQTMAAIDSPSRASSTLETILHRLATVVEDRELVAAAERLEKAATLLNELRDVLRLSSNGHHPLLHQRSVADGPVQARQREEHLKKWIHQLNQRRAVESDADRATDVAIVLDYLQIVYGGSLDNLPSSFAQNWQAGQRIRSSRRAKTTDHPIPAKRKRLREEGFLSKLERAVAAVIQQITTKRAAAGPSPAFRCHRLTPWAVLSRPFGAWSLEPRSGDEEKPRG